MELALRRAYGYAYGPKIRARAGFGMGFLGDDGSGETDTEGSTIPGTVDNSSGESGQLVVQYDPSTIPTTLTSTPTTQAAVTASTTTPVVDSSGVVWSCDSSGNCCNPSMVCQQGPPSILTSAPPNATVGQNASAAASNQSAAQFVAALASAAAVAGKSVVGAPGSIQCGNGVAVPSGSKCPGAVGASVCATGLTLSGSSCVASGIIPGLSNSTLVIVAIVAFVVMSMGKKR